MDSTAQLETYNTAKALLKSWEHEYRAEHNKRPDRRALSAASSVVQAAYATYYKLRAEFSSVDSTPGASSAADGERTNATHCNGGEASAKCTANNVAVAAAEEENIGSHPTKVNESGTDVFEVEQYPETRYTPVKTESLNRCPDNLTSSTIIESAVTSRTSTQVPPETSDISCAPCCSTDQCDGQEKLDSLPIRKGVWDVSLNRAISETLPCKKSERAPLSDLYSKLADNMRASFLASPVALPRMSLKRRSTLSSKKKISVGPDMTQVSMTELVAKKVATGVQGTSGDHADDSIASSVCLKPFGDETHSNYDDFFVHIPVENSENAHSCAGELGEDYIRPNSGSGKDNSKEGNAMKKSDSFNFDNGHNDFFKSGCFKVRTVTPKTSTCPVNIASACVPILSGRLTGKINTNWVERCIIGSVEPGVSDVLYNYANNSPVRAVGKPASSPTSVDSDYGSLPRSFNEESILDTVTSSEIVTQLFDTTASIDEVQELVASADVQLENSKFAAVEVSDAIEDFPPVVRLKRKKMASLEELEEDESITPVWPPPKRTRVSRIIKNTEEEVNRYRLSIKARQLRIGADDDSPGTKQARPRRTLAARRSKKVLLPPHSDSPVDFQRGIDNLVDLATRTQKIVEGRGAAVSRRGRGVGCSSSNRVRSDSEAEERTGEETTSDEDETVASTRKRAKPTSVQKKMVRKTVPADRVEQTKQNEEQSDPKFEESTSVPEFDEQLEMENDKKRRYGGKRAFVEKQDRLTSKLNSGSINENFVKIDLKKKTFVRGKKFMTGLKFRRMEWKRKQGLKTSGRGGGGRGGGGSAYSKKLTCFKCGDFGHWASKCPGKMSTDSILNETDRPPVSFLTLEEAADMAKGIKSQSVSTVTRVYSLKSVSNLALPTAASSSRTALEESIIAEDGQSNSDSKDDCDLDLSCGRQMEEDEVAAKTVVLDDEAAYSATSSGQDLITAFDNEVHDEYDFDQIEKDATEGLARSSAHNTPSQCDNPYASRNSYRKGRMFVDPVLSSDITQCPQEVMDTLMMFGHSSFRPGQETAILRILQGKSTLLVLSTGSGKSLCYQLPAYLYALRQQCITLCVSPLVSLMEDQVTGLPAFLRAVCLHTNQTPQQREKALQAVRDGKAHILLVSPEAVVASGAGGILGTLMKDLPAIGFACVDEAHCVSQWSHNFRPSYLRVCRVLREQLGVRTILGLTATARHETTLNIAEHLQVRDPAEGVITGSSVPPNLQLSVSRDANRAQALIQLLQGERFSTCDSIIVYCTRRDECERVATLLRTQLLTASNIDVKANLKRNRALSFDAEAYHAGLSAHRRRQIQNRFMSGKLRIVVATVAFGMGIDKADVRAIIHYNMPSNLESYVQEIGRAGRDGRESQCHLFLDSLEGRDVQELKRFTFVNSVDRVTVRKLLDRVFVSCCCMEQTSDENTNEQRFCPKHEVALSVSDLVEHLDLPEENILTLLCYLELRGEDLLQLMPSVYSTCTLACYGGPAQLCAVSKQCPPLAIAIAKDNARSINHQNSNSITFPVVQISSEMGWSSGVVKRELKSLEWSTSAGSARPSGVKVQFSDLSFHLMVRGNLSDDDRDRILDELHARAMQQETDQLRQLQYTHQTLRAASHASILLCSDVVDPKRCNALKQSIGRYFSPHSNELEKVVLEAELELTSGVECGLRQDIRSLLSTHTDQTWTARAIARVFHGIQSPNFPASVWGRVRRVWRAHINVPFKQVLLLAQQEIIKWRKL